MNTVKDYPPYLDYPKPRKPMTNADLIRAMSDEQLAKWLMEESWDCNDCPEHEWLAAQPDRRVGQCDMKCKEHCLDWLRQPVKDGENE